MTSHVSNDDAPPHARITGRGPELRKISSNNGITIQI
jgi:hypothetical protein